MIDKHTPPRVRIAFVAVAFLLAFVLLIVQLVRWQVVERSLFLPESRAPSDEAALRPAAQQRGAERGEIVDINGVPLAFDTFRWEVWVEPKLVPDGEAPQLAADLAQVLGPELRMSPDELLRVLTSDVKGTVTLTKQAPQPVGEAIASWDRFDVHAKPIPVRFYPQGALAAHMLGFVNGEPRAYYGIEEHYDHYLRSLDADFLRSNAEIRAAYTALPAGWRQSLPSNNGQDLVLTFDRRVQYVTEKILADALGRYRAVSGTIIIMEPHTGAILAMASLPAYDPNQYGKTNTTVLIDPAISKQYEPGSVFKIITMSAGVDAGLITPNTVFTDTLSMYVGGRTIHNSLQRSYGQVTVRQALVHSLNIPTAQVALKLQPSLFYQYVRRFGFGQLTEIDLANEGAGTVKVPGDELWSPSDLATNSFGQGLAVTPLQMATATAAIANGGMLVRPHVVDSMVFRGRVIPPDTAPIRRVIKPETARTVADMMVSVVEEGSPAAKVPGYVVAGKTGTAQVAIEGGYHPTETIHSFVGFVPADDPRFVAIVKLDVPKTNPWADSTATPTFARLAIEILRIMHVPSQEVAVKP